MKIDNGSLLHEKSLVQLQTSHRFELGTRDVFIADVHWEYNEEGLSGKMYVDGRYSYPTEPVYWLFLPELKNESFEMVPLPGFYKAGTVWKRRLEERYHALKTFYHSLAMQMYEELQSSLKSIQSIATIRDVQVPENIAAVRFQDGEIRTARTAEEESMCTEQQEERYQKDSWETRIDKALQNLNATEERSLRQEGLKMGWLLEKVLSLSPREMNRSITTRVGTILTRFGFQKKRRRVGGERFHVYINATRYPEHKYL